MSNLHSLQIPKFNRAFGTVSNKMEYTIKLPLVFTLIVLYQGLFSGNAMTIPKNLKSAFDNQIF